MKNKRFSQDNKFKVPLTQNVSQINCVKVILIYKSWYKPIGWLVFASSQVTRIRRGYMKNLPKHLISKTKTNIKCLDQPKNESRVSVQTVLVVPRSLN